MSKKPRGKDWAAIVARVLDGNPSARDVDWAGIFTDDPQILGDLINDVIKVGIARPGRPGKRSVSSESAIIDDLKKLSNEDHSYVDLPKALRSAMRSRSLRQTALLSGLDKMVVTRLLRGDGEPPTMEHMEALARGLRKSPGYFKEYRAAYVASAVYDALMLAGEQSVIFYDRVRSL